MIGAIIGDIIGSQFEFANIKTKNFPLFTDECAYTDDTIMTVAVAKAILERREKDNKPLREYLVEYMQYYGKKYPHPMGGYGGNFARWLQASDPQPYGSYGNGAAMRVSPCGLIAVTLREAQELAKACASVSHNHPEGIKGAQAVASAVYLAKTGTSKEEIAEFISKNYYNLNFTLDQIREDYRFDESCQGSVPQAIVAFLESKDFEDAIRNVVSIGGDTDTTGAITGSIAWSYYFTKKHGWVAWGDAGWNDDMRSIMDIAMGYLPAEFCEIIEEFYKERFLRAGTYARVGMCKGIL